MLVPEITRDQEQIGAQLLQEAEQDTGGKNLRAAPAMTNPARTAAARGDAGKAEETRRKTTDCCPTQLTPGWRKESIP